MLQRVGDDTCRLKRLRLIWRPPLPVHRSVGRVALPRSQELVGRKRFGAPEESAATGGTFSACHWEQALARCVGFALPGTLGRLCSAVGCPGACVD